MHNGHPDLLRGDPTPDGQGSARRPAAPICPWPGGPSHRNRVVSFYLALLADHGNSRRTATRTVDQVRRLFHRWLEAPSAARRARRGPSDAISGRTLASPGGSLSPGGEPTRAGPTARAAER